MRIHVTIRGLGTIQPVIVQVLDDFHSKESLPAKYRSESLAVHQIAIKKTCEISTPNSKTNFTKKKGIEVPPYEIIAVLTGASLNKFKSLVAFLYRCKGTTLHCAPVFGWKRRKFPDSNFNVTSCQSSRVSARQKLRLIIHPPINEHHCLAATV